MSDEAIDLAKAAVSHFYRIAKPWVKAGCSDLSEIIAEFLRRRGFDAKAVYGLSKKGENGKPFGHAWIDIEGEEFDPVLWVQKRPLSQYQYLPDESVRQEFEAGVCALRGDVDQGALAELERQFPR